MNTTATNQAQEQKDLKKTQALCNASNRRYKNDQNDDDQVRCIFNFQKKTDSVAVLVGYDEYSAILSAEILQYIKDNPETETKHENGQSYIKYKFSTAVINTRILNLD
jgi:hypothetical protein